jgi:hypothetical protein
MEIWKDVVGYEGYYKVSNYGNIKSVTRTIKQKNGRLRTWEEKKMKWFLDDSGYPRIALAKHSRYKKHKVHRLVAEAFIPNPNNYPQVNHIDSNRENFNVDNLEWCTAKQNVDHCKKSGRRHKQKTGFENKLSRPVVAINISTGERTVFGSQKLASEILGLHQTHVNGCVTGRCLSTGGYKFESLI